MRGLVIVNPNATSTTPRAREVLVGALAYQLQLRVAHTSHRGHAAELAAQARAEGLDIVVALGGDGTVHEVVNGMLGEAGPGPDVPKLGIVPGGSANVFIRSLGYPVDPVEATGELISRIRAGSSRAVNLGMVNGQYFVINFGLGIDAEIIEDMEAARKAGKEATSMRYLSTTIRRFFKSDRTDPNLAVSVPGMPLIRGIYEAFVLNTAPISYLGAVAMNPAPDASLDAGLDLWAVRSLSFPAALGYGRRMFGSNGATSGRNIVSLHDLPGLTIMCDEPTKFQVDGEGMGVVDRVECRSVPDAIHVIV